MDPPRRRKACCADYIAWSEAAAVFLFHINNHHNIVLYNNNTYMESSLFDKCPDKVGGRVLVTLAIFDHIYCLTALIFR